MSVHQGVHASLAVGEVRSELLIAALVLLYPYEGFGVWHLRFDMLELHQEGIILLINLMDLILP